MFGMLLNADTLVASVLNADLAIKCSCSDAIATNSEDTAIASDICGTLFQIFIVCVICFLLWRIIEYFTNKYQFRREKRWEARNKEWELANQLLERYLDCLKSKGSDKKAPEPKKDIVDLKSLQDKAYQALEDASSSYGRTNLQKILLSLYTELLKKNLNPDSGAADPTKDKSSQNPGTTNPSNQESANDDSFKDPSPTNSSNQENANDDSSKDPSPTNPANQESSNGESPKSPSPTEPAKKQSPYEQVLASLLEKLLSGQLSKISLKDLSYSEEKA